MFGDDEGKNDGYEKEEGSDDEGVKGEAEEASMSALFKAMKSGNAKAGRTAMKSFIEACYPDLGKKSEE